MKDHVMMITESDMRRLSQLLALSRRKWREWPHLQSLEEHLEDARMVGSAELPRELVTMNSRVRVVDIDTGRRMVYQVVFPQDACLEENRISVLAPIGTALLGMRTGEEVEWQVPGGVRRLRVEAVEYQPQARGIAA